MESGSAVLLTDVFSMRRNLRPQVDLSGHWALCRDPDDRGKGQG